MADEQQKQNSVDALKKAADKIKEEKYDEKLDVKDVAVDILGIVFRALIGFGWMMLMLLIISFVSLSYIHFEIKTMILVSVLTGVVLGGASAFKAVAKYIHR